MNELQRQYTICRRFAKLISDIHIPIETFINDLLVWFKKPAVKKNDPYACLFRISLKIKKNGRGANPREWGEIFPRIEKIVEIINDRGSIYARIIMNETIAHRYADYFIQMGIHSEKMKKCYKKAHELAVKYKYLKNIDSTLYWLAVAYEKGGRPDLARKYYCKVALRKGKRFDRDTHKRKIRLCKLKCSNLR